MANVATKEALTNEDRLLSEMPSQPFSVTSIQYKPTHMSPKEEGASTLINADGDVSAVNISFAGEHLDSTKKMDVSELQTISSPPHIEAQQPATVIPIEKDGMLNL